jgi:hypothetical protein
MRLKRIITILFVAAIAFSVKAQDTIHMRSGETIIAKVSDVGTSEITYKKWGHMTGPNYSILKSDVAVIKYQDGATDEFKQTPPPPAPVPQAPIPGQYVITLAQPGPPAYSMIDSTVSSMPRLRISVDFLWGNLLVFSGRVSASYLDFKSDFQLGGYAGIDGFGADGTLFLIRSHRKVMKTIPFAYQGTYHTHLYSTIQHDVEKVTYVGLHMGYSLHYLSDATFQWLSYYHNMDDNTYTSPSTGTTFTPSGPSPTYGEIEIGPQFVFASKYKAALNDGSGLVASHEVVTTIGLDALIYPSFPNPGATYDSIAVIMANRTSSNYTLAGFPNNNFANSGFRFYIKMQFGFSSGNSDWGLDWQASLEQNLSGFGYMMGLLGIYFCPK